MNKEGHKEDAEKGWSG